MKKRFLSLVLAFVMLVTVALTGCTTTKTEDEAVDDINDEASSSTKTISMYVVTEKEVSEKTAEQVNYAFNNITKAKFKTQVCIHFLTYDNYYSTIEGIIEDNAAYEELREQHEDDLKKAVRDAKAEKIATDSAFYDDFYAKHPEYVDFRETQALTGDDTTAEETVLVTIEGAEGKTIAEIKYPDETPYQLDIIWIDSYERYMQYIDNDWLSRLDDELTSSSKKLKEYIQPSLLAWAKWAGAGTYGIPNNHAIGEYTYLLLNKELVDKYNYNPEKLNSITNCADFLADVAKYESDYQPVAGKLKTTSTFYWTYDAESKKIIYDEFSLIGNGFSTEKTLDPTSTTNPFIGSKNVFTISDYTSQLRSIQLYKDLGYVAENVEDGTKFALSMVSGGAELQEKYADDYYMNVIETPRISEEDVFGSMFAVSSFTNSLSRSMEVVTYLNTNSNLRNILQYGIEGVNYTLNDDGTVHRLNDDYVMNIRNTGNAFVAYVEEGNTPDLWNYGKIQNSKLVSNLINCFRVSDEDLEKPADSEELPLDVEALATLRTESAKIKAELDAVQNSAELEALIEKYSTHLASITKVQTNLSKTDGIYYVYYQWMLNTSLYVPQN